MAHVVRAWRASRMIRLFALIAVLVTATQLVPSGDTGGVQDTTRHTVMIGKDRLVSVEPLPEMAGEICLPASAPESLMAALQLPGSGAAARPVRPSQA